MNVDKANAALDSVYSADTPEGLAKAYADWAATYDSETASLGYLLPFLITAWVARHVPAGEGSPGRAVRFAGDTDQFVTTAGDGRIRLLRPDGGEVRSFGGAAGFVYAAAVTRDGATLVAGGEDGTLRTWNVADGKPLATLPPPDAVAAARP